ncbi:MAG: flagellar basal-body rod protein FlgG [Pseudomonadota bacterium]|jgi:flagellar basal-body rod protein FlgG|nr:flagellar basal-body rod protein FlgG [Alphaproteobacteria bacterium]
MAAVSVQDSLNIARTGLQAQEALLAIKTQNIASQNVDGFKRQYLIMYDLPYIDHGAVGVATSQNGTTDTTGVQIGTGVQAAAVYRVFSQGEAIQTGRSLDVMIDGDGFFMVTLPDGTTGYTRVGSFNRDQNNTLVMPKTGYVIQPGITLPQNTLKVSINQVGEVYAETSPGQEVHVGQIQLATFLNPSGLLAVGDSIFVQTNASGAADVGEPGKNQRGYLKQAYREGSNVNAVEEMTDLIKIEKVYEMLTKAVKTGDEMMKAANSMGAR